jgi:hypothetical protein
MMFVANDARVPIAIMHAAFAASISLSETKARSGVAIARFRIDKITQRARNVSRKARLKLDSESESIP